MAALNVPTRHFKAKIPINNVHVCELIDDNLKETYQVPIFDTERWKNEAEEMSHSLEKYYENNKESWEHFLKRADVYAQLKYDIKKRFNGQFVNNSWLKFHEIVNEYELLPKSEEEIGDNFNVFLNAELPGSAASALNHYIKAQGKSLIGKLQAFVLKRQMAMNTVWSLKIQLVG